MTRGVVDPAAVRRAVRSPYGILVIAVLGATLFALGLRELVRREYVPGTVAHKVQTAEYLYLVDADGRACVVGPGRYVTTQVGDRVVCRWRGPR